jgi:hypothetical protein
VIKNLMLGIHCQALSGDDVKVSNAP